MKRLGLNVKILECTDEHQPHWVRFSLVDAWDKEWFFEDKLPIVSLDYLDKKSEYPQTGFLSVDVIDSYLKDDIDISKILLHWGVEDSEGNNEFEIKSADLFVLDLGQL